MLRNFDARPDASRLGPVWPLRGFRDTEVLRERQRRDGRQSPVVSARGAVQLARNPTGDGEMDADGSVVVNCPGDAPRRPKSGRRKVRHIGVTAVPDRDRLTVPLLVARSTSFRSLGAPPGAFSDVLEATTPLRTGQGFTALRIAGHQQVLRVRRHSLLP